MSEGKRYFWLKLYDDFFTSKRIKKLRNLAGGDTYTIIYLKMQLKALKTEGYLYFDGVMTDFAEELALDIDENPEDVKVTITYLLAVGLLEQKENDEYILSYMKNLIGSETASAQRVREHRNRKKEEKVLHCNAPVTEMKQVGNADIDIDKEKDIDKVSSLHSDTSSVKTDYDIILDMWNELDGLGNIKAIKNINEGSKRRDNVRARLKQYGIDGFREAIDRIKQSDFLQGKSKEGWFITFDWFVLPNNFSKVLEGNYDNTNKPKKNAGFERFV